MRKRRWFCKTGSDVIAYPDCSQIWSVKTKCFQIHKVFHGVKHYDYGSTATTKRHSYSVRFFRLLCSQTGRIRRNFNCSNYEKFEESYALEINLIGYLHQLLGILNELRCHGKVGRPRFIVKFPTVLGQVLTVVFQLRRSLLSIQ